MVSEGAAAAGRWAGGAKPCAPRGSGGRRGLRTQVGARGGAALRRAGARALVLLRAARHQGVSRPADRAAEQGTGGRPVAGAPARPGRPGRRRAGARAPRAAPRGLYTEGARSRHGGRTQPVPGARGQNAVAIGKQGVMQTVRACKARHGAAARDTRARRRRAKRGRGSGERGRRRPCRRARRALASSAPGLRAASHLEHELQPQALVV